MRLKPWMAVLICLITILGGCAAPTAAPVVSVAPTQEVVRGTHTVRDNESLYLIAWRYGRDYRDIAIANGIHEPYKIFPGQRLTLRKPTQAQLNAFEKPKAKQVKKVAKQSAKPKAKEKAKPTKKTWSMLDTSRDWMWPAQGNIISRFTQKPKINKGIDIANKKGTPIKATQPGKVVYSGQGLRGYGKLLIIKHDDDYLSAYAHNDELLVKEGQNVKQGQTIATMGRSDSNQVKLHFEIRKKGQPVDPLGYLSKGRS